MSKGNIARRLRDDPRGQALIFVAIALVGIFAVAGFAIDTVQALQLRRELQSSTDAAALAAAQVLPDTVGAIAAANAYSSIDGGINRRPNHPTVTMVPGYPQTKCLITSGIPCNPDNAVVVRQQSDVPTFFARVVGMNSIHITATATASMRGGVPKPLDVIVIVDTTQSMNDPCSASVPGISSPSLIDCAKAGVRALLNGLWPCPDSLTDCGPIDTNGHVEHAVDEVGLMVFPGLKASTNVNKEFDCVTNLASNEVARYENSPVYLVVPMVSDYRTSASSGLNGGVSKMVKAVEWASGNTCTSSHYGIENPGIHTYFADAITAAQSTLAGAGRASAQNVIILLSDGDANSDHVSNPCHRAVDAAQAAAAAGTWVYSIAYGASTSTSSSCTLDSPPVSALTTMQNIASDSTKFFNQPTAGDLTDIFRRIVLDLTTTRLFPDDVP
jgi:Putative Flp pilus-assembly TadE/G-like/von Willebrand factor type A domain